jgi:hypothetical protein
VKFHRFARPTTAIAAAVALGLTSLPTSAFGQKLLSEGAHDLATQIAASVAKEQKRRIAVLPFRLPPHRCSQWSGVWCGSGEDRQGRRREEDS